MKKLSLNAKIAKLRRLIKSRKHIVRYKGNEITGIDDTGILVWELYGPNMSDHVSFIGSTVGCRAWRKDLDWKSIQVYTLTKTF